MDNSLGLSADELWLLVNQWPPAVVIGFLDPMRGLLAAEIQDRRTRALQSLHQRGIVQLNRANAIEVEEVAGTLIKTIINPTSTVMVALRTGVDQEVVHSFHHNGSRIVKLSGEAMGQYTVVLVKNRSEIIDSMMSMLPKGLPTRGKRGTPFHISESALNRARELLGQGSKEDAKQVLVQSGLSRTQVAAFAPALSKPIMNMSVVVFRNRDKPERIRVSGCAVVAAGRKLWLLEPSEPEGTAAIHTLTTYQLRSELDKLLP